MCARTIILGSSSRASSCLYKSSIEDYIFSQMAAILYKVNYKYRFVFITVRNVLAEHYHEFIPRSVHQYIIRKGLCVYNLSNMKIFYSTRRFKSNLMFKSDL